MSEHGYRQFLPGDEIELKLTIKYPRMHLREVGVVFRHEERGAAAELLASSTPEAEREHSVAQLTVPVPDMAVPGIYRVHRLWVETYGGRIYRYEGEEVAEITSRFAVEVIPEPDEKPELELRPR
jgi:hypothetical protein